MESKFVKASIFISASPACIWDVLTNPAELEKYMGYQAHSDWNLGSPIRWEKQENGRHVRSLKGSVVELIPSAYLAFTLFEPKTGIEDRLANYLTVTYELLQENLQTKLLVSEGDFGSVMNGDQRLLEARNYDRGWNEILSRIKELAEISSA